VSKREKTPPAIGSEAWLAHLVRHVPIARAGEDREGVHQVRVACARLDVFLRLGERRALRDDLRWLRERASAVRDLDVLLASAPPEPFALWLAGERVVARAALLEALESPRLRALLDAWRWLPPLRRERARKLRRELERKCARRVRKALAPDAPPDAPLEALHAARRAVRRLRYADEWLGRRGRPLAQIQDALGEVNDLSVARRWLAACPHEHECELFRADLERRLARARRRASAALAERWPRKTR
jgi:CHAD domain-containing protein